MKKVKRIWFIGLLLFAVLALTGCGADVFVIRYEDKLYYYEDVQINIEKSLLSLLNGTAETKQDDVTKWTVESYLKEAAALATNMISARYLNAAKDEGEKAQIAEKDYGYSYRGLFETTDGKSTVYYFIGRFAKGDKRFTNPAVEKENLFLRTVFCAAQNTLEGLYEQYVGQSGGKEAISVINGSENFPAITDAFPKLREYDAGSLNLYQCIESPRRSASELPHANEYISAPGSKEIGGAYFIIFESKFNDPQPENVPFSYHQPISVGWNVIALCIGVLTLFIVLLLSFWRKKKGLYEKPDAEHAGGTAHNAYSGQPPYPPTNGQSYAGYGQQRPYMDYGSIDPFAPDPMQSAVVPMAEREGVVPHPDGEETDNAKTEEAQQDGESGKE